MTTSKEAFFRNGHGFFVVYDITKRSSFENVEKHIQKIIHLKRRHNIPLVIVGNKSDIESKREVSEEEGRNLSKKFRNCSFFQTSAKNANNIIEIFRCLISKCCTENTKKVKKKN